jgi:hypothetical protein
MGFIPLDEYSLKSSQNLDGRVQLEFISVADEYMGSAVEQELVSQMNSLGTPMFAATSQSDQKTASILSAIGFKPVAEMEITENGEEPVILWLDNVDIDKDGNVVGAEGGSAEEPDDVISEA